MVIGREIDIKNLTTENITMLGGSPWIVSKRQKTGVPFQIKLMDIPMQIIKRYEPDRISSNLFNFGSHDMINKRIKEVAKLYGIEKRTSFHLNRHLNLSLPLKNEWFTIAKFSTGNDLETSGVPHFSSSCIKSKERFTMTQRYEKYLVKQTVLLS